MIDPTSPQLSNLWQPLPLRDVVIHDEFWAPRQQQLRSVTLPHQYQQLKASGHMDALSLSWKPGETPEPHIFWESDIAKWIEAASYCLATQHDEELDDKLDHLIAQLAAAQQPDGYLNVYFTVVKPGRRFTDLRDTHELYCAGHLIEAAVAHYEATGKTTLLDIMRRYADLLVSEFGPGGSLEGGYDGHQEIELALVRLFRVTAERSYLDLAARFINFRGTKPYYFDRELERRGAPGYFGSVFPTRDQKRAEEFRRYNQSHLPVREQSQAVGHAVRAMYMYSAMADLAAELGDETLWQASERLWYDVTQRRMYITGGLGSRPEIEGFGDAYHLPNYDGYGETCAAIGLVFWAQRMAAAAHDARYIDVLEQALFNGVLSGISDDGKRYFYGNPLASRGAYERSEWFGCACCPPNLARLIASLGKYAYATHSEGESREAVINLFVGSRATFRFGTADVTLHQHTPYPWGGTVTIDIAAELPTQFTLALRIPGWAADAKLTVNGAACDLATVFQNGYACLTRTWQAGDNVQLSLNMRAERVYADPRITSCAGRVALRRGPVVYCAESADNSADTANLVLPRTSELHERDQGGRYVSISTDGQADVRPDGNPPLYSAVPVRRTPALITAVPYYTWGNRGAGAMTVWLREN